jgi:uncharacterized caspase-like protein
LAIQAGGCMRQHILNFENAAQRTTVYFLDIVAIFIYTTSALAGQVILLQFFTSQWDAKTFYLQKCFMSKPICLLSLLFSLLFAAWPCSSFSTMRGISVTAGRAQNLYLYKDYYALVVGVSDYEQWPDLPSAGNDAKEVAAELKEIGFEVKLVLNPSAELLRKALSDIAYEKGGEENRALLFYFAGHGDTIELADGTQLGYIVPSDCPLKKADPMGFDSKAISMKDIEVLALKVKSRHFIMLFDSCFSGSLFSVVRAAPVDISEKSALPVRQFITAGGAGEQVPDQSVFKVVFMQGITGDADLNADGYVTGSELGMYLQEKVVNYTRGGQHPQYGKINNPKLDRGDFIFVSQKMQEKQIAVQSAPEATAPQNAPEITKPAAVESSDVRLASIPPTAMATQEVLKRGQGPFVLDDFEDQDLWSRSFNDKWKYFKKGDARLDVSADTSQAANGTSGSMKIEYDLGAKSVVTVRLGVTAPFFDERYAKMTYDLSRFNRLTFYLKGEKASSFLSRPSKILINLICYSESANSRNGKMVQYYNRNGIVPETDWQKIEIPFDDFIPARWTLNNVSNYPPKPDFGEVLQIFFMISSFESEGGVAGSNTIWIDEIMLQ